MKKLMSVVLVLVVLCTISVSVACAEKVLTIEEMQERISDLVGYKPYCIVESCGDAVEEWTFIMHGGVIGTWSNEDIAEFMELVTDYQYDWYQQLPEMVEITTEQGLDILGQGIHFEVNLDESNDDSLVIDFLVWSQKIEDFQKTEDGYIFSRKELAKLVYADEMASIRYMAELLEEAMN